MKTKNILFSVIVLLAFLVTACGGASTPAAPPVADAAQDTMAAIPAWYSVSLTDASTSQAFTIQGFSGKVVLVETMAMWCSNCVRQQNEVKALHELLGERDDFISIGVDIDINEDLASLKGYVESNGFDWLYTVASPDVARDIAAQYGEQFLNPPSTPMLVIDRHGVAHPLPFGIKSAEELLQAIQPYLDEGV